MKKMDISVKILDKDYRKAQENLIEIARKTAELLDDESTALDSPTNKEVHLIDAKGRSTPLIYESLKLSWPELYQLYRANGATLIPGNDRIVIDVEDPVKGVTRAIADSNENPNVADITGKTPLINAAQYHMARISKKLIEAGADIHLTDGNDETALIYALRGGNKKISLALVNAGADINFRDKYERTPLIYAFQNHWPVIAEKLMKDGAEINVAKDDKAAIGTALVWAAKKGHEKITQALIKARVDVNFRDKDRRTALMYAASNNNNVNKETIARMLIDAGADVNAVDREGKTALNWAAKNGSEEIIQSLLAAGADINVNDKYQNTPFMTAVQEEQESIVGILNDVLQKGI